MHHPRSKTAIFRFRLASVLLVGNSIFALTAGFLLIRSLVSSDSRGALIGAGLLILVLLLVVAQWIAGSGTRCPLCCTPVLAPMRCSKHRHARTRFGSHRLRVALSILCRNQFRCIYCNEVTDLEVREMHHRHRQRGPELD